MSNERFGCREILFLYGVAAGKYYFGLRFATGKYFFGMCKEQ
jgi:hypothetical protein